MWKEYFFFIWLAHAGYSPNIFVMKISRLPKSTRKEINCRVTAVRCAVNLQLRWMPSNHSCWTWMTAILFHSFIASMCSIFHCHFLQTCFCLGYRFPLDTLVLWSALNDKESPFEHLIFPLLHVFFGVLTHDTFFIALYFSLFRSLSHLTLKDMVIN